MSYLIKAYANNDSMQIKPLSVSRDWMINGAKNAYRCMPVSTANSYGWGIFLNEDVSFIWDGKYLEKDGDLFSNHLKILKGRESAFINNGSNTLAFKTGISVETDPGISILLGPVPNQFLNGLSGFSTILSTSFYRDNLPVSYNVTIPNDIITIKSGTPIACFVPISLVELNHSTVEVFKFDKISNSPYLDAEYGKALEKASKTNNWSNFYRNAIDHKGNKLGSHDVSNLKINVSYEKDFYV